MRKGILFVAVLLSIWSFGRQIAFAQATASATLEGTVTDKSQAVIRGATVTIANKATGVTRSVMTNDVGSYRFELLSAGKYSLKVTASGFASAVTEDVELPVGRTTTLDYALNPGATSETVTVTGEVPIVDTQKTDLGLNLSPSEVSDLPLNGRDFANLAYLAPGARPVNSYDPTKNRLAVFAINGGQGRNVNITVNGVDNKDNTVGGPVMQLPLEAVQEFVISTQRFSAANGRSEGAAVNVVTKSGSNGFHGSAFIFERNERLNAKNFFEEQGNQPKSPFSRQQFGGSIGGPIVKDKTFFFFAIERQREITNIVANPAAVKELELVKSLGAQPAPIIPTPYRDLRYNFRFDQRFNENHNLFLTYNDQYNRGLNDQITQTSDLTAGNFTTNKLQLANLTLNSVLSPRVVNSFTFGYQYWNNLIDTDKQTPTFNFPGLITFGTNTNVPQQSYQSKWQFRDDISITTGNHALKTGFDFVHEPKLGGFFEFNPTLALTFLDLPSKILSDTVKYPQGFATPGAIIAMSDTAGDPRFDLPGGAKMFGVYIQDDWKVRRNLNFSLGLRWDKDFNLIGTQAQAKNRTYLALKAINHPVAARLPKDDSNNFSPRVGLAWDLKSDGKHVLRAGYGIYFGQTFLNIPLFMIQQINPTLFATVLDLSSAGPGDDKAPVVPGTNVKLSAFRFGVDPLPTTPAARANFTGNEAGRIMDPDYQNPYTQQWNIGYALQLTPGSAVEIDYVHVLSLRESKTIDINPTRSGVRPLTAAFLAAGRPALGRIDLESPVGRSRYDGLNISYRRRMSNSFSVNTNYVLSRGIAYNGNAAAFRNRPTNLDNIFAKHDFGFVPNDERHRWVFSGVVDLPWSFQLAPIVQLSSARPFTATQGIDVFGFGSGAGAAHVILRQDDPSNLLATKGMSAADLRACIAAGNCFQAPFDNLRGDAFFQVDLRVSKEIKFGDKPSLKLIFQTFDLTNRANFGNNFVGNVQSANFRKPNGFITPAGVIVPRSFSAEIGARFTF
jgi:carboxypeptidase family protein/TonB-dependent receptor-like protein